MTVRGSDQVFHRLPRAMTGQSRGCASFLIPVVPGGSLAGSTLLLPVTRRPRAAGHGATSGVTQGGRNRW